MRPKKNNVPERPWWSLGWLESARRGGLKTRLQRGKILAKEGRLKELQVEPGLLQGEIRMSAQIQYHPTIQWMIPSDTKIKKIVDEVERRPHVMAQLLNGQLDPEWQDIFSLAGSEFLPEELSELRLECSCGDPQNLCTHLAALFQLTADEFDFAPAKWLIFRGISPEEWQKNKTIPLMGSPEIEETFTAPEFWEGRELPPLPSNQNNPLYLLQNLGPFPLWQGSGKGPLDGLRNFYLAAAGMEEENEEQES